MMHQFVVWDGLNGSRILAEKRPNGVYRRIRTLRAAQSE